MSSHLKRRVEADEFVLRDRNGLMRAALTMTLDGPGFFLYDQSGIIRAGLLVGKDEPGLALFDGMGRPRVSVGLAADEPSLILRDAKGTSRAAMVVEGTGTRLMLSDANPGPRIGIAAQGGEVSQVFADTNGKPRIVVGMPGGVPSLTLLDAAGRRRAKLEIEEYTSAFELYDSDGKTSSSSTVVWVEPNQHAADTEAQLALEVNARKQLEETLRIREKRYNALTAATAQLVWTTNSAGEIIEDAPMWRSLTGQSEEEIKGFGWMQALHPEDRERVEGISKQAVETRSPYETEYRVCGQDGECSYFAVRAVPVLQDDEAVHEWVMFATNIAGRTRLEEALRVGEERFAALTAAHAQLEETQRANDERLSVLSATKAQLEEALRVSEERQNAVTAASAQLQESMQAGEATHAAERQRLEEALRASEERFAALTAAHAQLEETQRANEERLSALSATKAQLEGALRVSEERQNAVTAASAQLQESMQAGEATHAAERQRLEDALRASEERFAALTAAHAQLEETQRANEERLSALSATNAQLEEGLRGSDERQNALSAASAQLQESMQASETTHAAERQRLEEALRVGEERFAALTRAHAQLEETQRANEERLGALSATKAQLEEALRVSEERQNALTAASAQLQESMQASETTHAAEQQRLEEALRVSEKRFAALAATQAQLKEIQRVSEERLNALTATNGQLEEALGTSEERISALTEAKSHLEKTLRICGEDYTAGRKLFEDALRATEDKLSNQIVAKAQLEETLRAREKRYGALTAATAELAWTANAAGEITDAGPSWMTFTGQGADEAKGGGWLQALHPEDRELAREVLKQALQTRSPYKTEYRLRRHDGEYRVFAVRGAPVTSDDGAVYEWVGTATDITDDKQAEMLRRATEKKYRQVVEGAPEGIWIIDQDNRTTFANPRLAQILGWSQEEMPGKSLFDFLDDEGRQSALENLACCRRGVAVQYDLKLRNKEGHDLRTRASTLPLFDDVGQYSGALALIIDLTEQKLVEGQQQQAQKLQALGQLAGGVAHGLNNFLTVINGYSELLLGNIPSSNPMHESVAQIKKAGEHAVGLVSPLLAFSQGQILWPRVLALNEVVTEVEKTIRGELGEDIQLTTMLNPSLGPVKADPELLKQVLTNLAANAREAMRSGGNLVIETQNVDLEESFAAKHPGVQPGSYVHLTVSDSGVGMSQETLTHLFEPFFTTKSPGQGFGLGLATAYGFIKQTGGLIWVESELGKGSTFHIYLPRIGEVVPLPQERKPAVTTLRGVETVLVVEDQEEIRKLAEVVLKSYGYKVLVAPNGWDALLSSERHSGPIHLMLTDMMMPGMTGQELANRLRPLRPDMEVVFMSGRVENELVPHGTLDAGGRFLAKPFSPDALATKVREVLGAPRTAGKVLVVDDEVGVRSFLRTVLVSVGYEFLEATDGEQALEQLNGGDVDMILVDLEVGGQQDLEKIRSLRKRQPDVKLIAMSGTFGDEFLRAAEQLGAQATLSKPIRADQLLDAVRRMGTE